MQSIIDKNNKKGNIVIDNLLGAKVDLIEKIKSILMSGNTMFNSDISANFIYEIINNKLSESKIFGIEEKIFTQNIKLIDSKLPEIISFMLLYKKIYSKNKIIDLIKIINQKNPMKYDLSKGHPFYEYKIRNYLTECAAGMIPTKVWIGINEETKGLIILKPNDNSEGIFVYDKNKLQDILLNNTILNDTNSIDSDSEKYYEENGKYFIKLKLQLGFIH